MRHVLIIVLACAAGSSAAFAAPASRPHNSAKRTMTAQGSKHTAQPRDHRHDRGGGGVGGIHPLVGSGDY